MIDQLFVKRALSKLRRRLSTLNPQSMTSLDVEDCSRTLDDFLKEVYKHDTDYITQLKDLTEYTLYGVQFFVGGSPKDTDCESQKAESRYAAFKDKALAIVNEVDRSITTNGLPFSYKGPARRQWGKLFASFVLGIVIALVSVAVRGCMDSATKQSDNAAKARITYVDLRNWHSENTAAFKIGWDSIYVIHNGHSTSFDGVIVKDLVDYANAYSRRRRQTIDSFLVRLSAFGVDTDTIEIDRRLPIRVGSEIKSFEKRLGLDMGAYGEFYHLDRL